MIDFRFLAIKELRAKIKFKVMKLKNGTGTDLEALADTDEVQIVNGAGMTMFDDVIVSMQHQEIWRSHNNFGLLAHLQTAFSTTAAQKNREYSLSLWDQDTAGQGDKFAASLSSNEGGYKRRLKIKNSFSNTLIAPIPADVLMSGRPLVEGVALDISFIPSSPTRLFFITDPTQAPGGYKRPVPRLVIEDMTLLVKWIRPHVSLLRQPSPIYPLIVHKFLKFEHPKDLTMFGSRCINSFGVIPRRVTVWLMEQDRYNGSDKKSFLNIPHLDLSEISVGINGVVETRKFDFSEGVKSYAEAYHGLYTSGITSDTCPVSYGSYGSGGYVSN